MLPVTAKEDQGKATLAVYIAVKTFYPPFITNKMKRLVLKVGVLYVWKMAK